MLQRESLSARKSAPRALFLGMQSHFSHPSLRALLADGVNICAVMLPAPRAESMQGTPLRRLEPPGAGRRRLLPVQQSLLHTSVQQLAWEHALPLWQVTRLADPAVHDLFAGYRPDVLCAACFPQRLPPELLAIPRLGALNVHPSLLPANRGPQPLFWTFRLGQRQTGVTIHLMDERLDSGDILAQESIEVPEGISYDELEEQCALLGSHLLSRTVADLYAGRAVRQAQDECLSSSYPSPSSRRGRADFTIDARQCDARHIYTFIRGVKDLGEPLTLIADDALTLRVEDALVYSYKSHDLRLHTHECDTWPVRCRQGKVVVRGRPLDTPTRKSPGNEE
ncbi:MAG TPA: methionyl-tRNA formyltransferase [Ktedonobacteraceae bacterium]|jgi:methionyl-tRNA formyltransferase